MPFVVIQLWLLGSWARWRWHQGTTVGPLGVVRLLARETKAVYLLGFYHLRGLGRTGLRRIDNNARPVLCVHGITQNGTNMWGVRRVLALVGRPSMAVHLGRPFQSLDGYTPSVIRGLEHLLEVHDRVDVVCHSMGGVILRKALAFRPDLAARVHRIVTLGSPHLGTHSARGFEWFSHDVRALATGSKELARLPGFAALAPQATVTTVSAGWDVVVFPHAHAHLPDTHNVHIGELGHAGLITDPRAMQVITEGLR